MLNIIVITNRFAIAVDTAGKRYRVYYSVRPSLEVGQAISIEDFELLAIVE